MEGFQDGEAISPASGGLSAGGVGFTYERLLRGEDWVRWDPFPFPRRSPPIEVPTNTMDDEMLAILEDIEGPDFLRWLTNADLTPQLPDLPLEGQRLIRSLLDEDGREQLGAQINLFFEELVDEEEFVEDSCEEERFENIFTNLECRRYGSSEAEDERCVICLDEVEEGEEAGKVRCGHEFHFECIKKWLMMKNCCPLCKSLAWDNDEELWA